MAATDLRGESIQLNASYMRAVQEAGGLPVLLAPQLDEATATAWMYRLDGIVLTGGGDVAPARYGETSHETVSFVSDTRDTLELLVTKLALVRRLPILAICRGMQVLNVALGGSLIQDIPSAVGTTIEHSQTRPTTGVEAVPRDTASHWIGVAPGSRLRDLLGKDSIETNSMHHQSVKVLGEGLIAVAWTEDGVVEGIEIPRAGFVVGVQWHPEELIGWSKASRRLFEGVVSATAVPAGR